MKVKIIDENQLTRPVISKQAMHRIVDNKDKQYKEMRRSYEIKLHDKTNECIMHMHNEKHAQKMFEEDMKRQRQITYLVGVAASLIGGAVGFVCG